MHQPPTTSTKHHHHHRTPTTTTTAAATTRCHPSQALNTRSVPLPPPPSTPPHPQFAEVGPANYTVTTVADEVASTSDPVLACGSAVYVIDKVCVWVLQSVCVCVFGGGVRLTLYCHRLVPPDCTAWLYRRSWSPPPACWTLPSL